MTLPAPSPNLFNPEQHSPSAPGYAASWFAYERDGERTLEQAGLLMQIDERTLAGLTILDLSGKLTVGDGAQLLKDKSESLIFQGRTHVIVNLAAVPYIDSGGLGELLACYSTLAKAGGRLTLVNLNTRNRDLLSITKLVTVFETFETEDGAVESYPAAVRA